MVGRFTGACLGLIAFAIAIVAGLSANNPPMLVLSRAVWALAIFCVMGLVLGAVAQAVLNEHQRRREEVVLGPGRAEQAALDDAEDMPDTIATGEAEPIEA
jgi:MFS family permease